MPDRDIISNGRGSGMPCRQVVQSCAPKGSGSNKLRRGSGGLGKEPRSASHFDAMQGDHIMSRTIKFARAGAPEVLEFVETQIPEPGTHEVRIQVKAIGINRAESMWRQDQYIEPVKFPAGLGYEAA